MTRRKFLTALFSLATVASIAQLKNAIPFKLLSGTPDNDGIIIKDGWILRESDL